MPELPEVETIRRSLDRLQLAGRAITGATVAWPRSVGGDPDAFCHAIVGSRVVSSGRRGKYLLYTLEPTAVLTIHLRMSGRLYLVPYSEPTTGYERVTLQLDDDRELRFYDPRKFGRMTIAAEAAPGVALLGPEPLEAGFTLSGFAAELGRRRRAIKPLLLDQSVVAGLGNIYADEALWQAQIHPLCRSDQISDRSAAALHTAVRDVLTRGLRNHGTSLGTGKVNFVFPGTGYARNQEELQVFRRTGLPCPRCGSTIERIVVAQRSTHLCPVCQVAPG